MEAAGDFHDWEILQNSDENPVPVPNSTEKWKKIDRIGSDSGGLIRSDYFAIHHGKKLSGPSNEVGAKKVVRDEGTEISREKLGVFELGSPDLGLAGDAKREVGFGGIEVSSGKVAEFLSGSGAANVVSWKVEGFDEWGFGDDAKREVGLEGIREIQGAEVQPKNSEEFWSDMSSDDGMVFEKDIKGEEKTFEGIAIERRQTDELLLDSSNKALVAGESGDPEGGGELFDGEFSKEGSGSPSFRVIEAEGEVERDVGVLLPVRNAAADEVKAGEGEKKTVVWWKMPLELLKFCVFRVSPVWSISIAAAVLGIVILRKRLYRTKQKSRSIPVNVCVDEKKVSQVMVRVARLNEAFSVVRRIPIVRAPVRAAGGVATWPVMSLR